MAFTTLVLAQLFNVFNARSDERERVRGLFTNRWLWGAIALSLALPGARALCAPMQQAFGTVGLTALDWVRCAVAASAVLWVSEVTKLIERRRPVALPVHS